MIDYSYDGADGRTAWSYELGENGRAGSRPFPLLCV